MKKNYTVAVKNQEDWEIIHQLLTQGGTLEDNIPSRSCDCTNEKVLSPTRSTYLLDEEEVELLKNHPKIFSVNLDPNFHFEEYQKIFPQHQLRSNRFNSNVKNYRTLYRSTEVSNTPPLTKLAAGANWSQENKRVGYQLLRLTQKDDPWYTPTDRYTETTTITSLDGSSGARTGTNTISSDIQYTYDGSGVDVIVIDDACWLGHPEFVDNSGISQVRDLILDGPYFLDLAYFNANPSKTITYIGRTTCTEIAAREWWSDATKRSAVYQVGGAKYFSPINVPSTYTRATLNGSSSAYPSLPDAFHGTPCASQAYGKTLGWAFNSNKWFINSGFDGIITTEQTWDIIIAFHTNKDNNPTYGDKNPLVLSASWGPNATVSTTGTNYYKYRTNSRTSYTSATIPEFLYHINNGSENLIYQTQLDPSSEVSAAEELMALSRVFLFYASGNFNTKTVLPDHPDYNNYWNNSNSDPTSVVKYVNRVGYPGNLGYDSNYGYAPFSIGSLHDAVILDSGVKKEQRLDSSCVGNGIDLFAPANRSLGASVNTNSNPSYYLYERYDGIPGDGNSYSSLSIKAYDTIFSGTSSATPVAAGFFACFLQNRRNWSWRKLKKFIKNSIQNQSSSRFYIGNEANTANHASFADYSSLQGAEPKIPYLLEAPTITITSQPTNQTLDPAKTTAQGNLAGNSATFSVTATQDSITGSLSYQWQRAQPSTPSTFTDISGATSTSYTITTDGSGNVNGAIYRCKISGTNGVDDTFSNTAILTVRTFTLSSAGSANEGSTATFNLATSNVANGTTLYYSITGTNVTASDFSDNSLTGSFTVNSNSGSFSKTIVSDLTTEGTEFFNIYIRTGSPSGNAIESGSFTINDTSVSLTSIPITSQPSNQNLDPPKVTGQGTLPGNSASFSVTATQNATTGTLSYQWERAQPSTPTTFVNIASANSNTYIISAPGDGNVNGAIYRCKISGTGAVTDTYSNTATLTIRGFTLTSTSPSFDEGTTAVFNIATSNVSNGTTLYYSISGTNIDAGDFVDGTLNGSFTVNSNFGSFSKVIASDIITEGSESFNVFIRTSSVSGNAVESGSFTINDTSTGIPPNPSVPPGANVSLSGLNISGVTIS